MIKILFFVENLSSGGAEKVLRTLVNNMDQSRFDITVMTVWPEPADEYLVPGIHYRSLYARWNRFNHMRFRLEAALNLTYRLHIHGGYDIEVAYLECGPTKIMAGSTNRKALKLAWVHCDLKQKFVNAVRAVRTSKKWYSKYHKVVCVSENVKQSYTELFGTVPESVVVHNVNDETQVLRKAAEARAESPSLPTFIAVGRLSPEKGNDRLLEACARLKRSGYSFRCWLIGDGPERQRLEDIIAQNDLHEYVEQLGFQSNPYPYMAAADFLVCPSRFEGFSTVVTEALILGKPVLTTACSGMSELLGNSEYGLITENSTDGIYQGLKKLLDDPCLLKEYEILARERGRVFYKANLLKQTEDFFINALEARTAQ